MTLSELRTWLESLAEVEATLPARVFLERLPPAEVGEEPATGGPTLVEDPLTWRERLWLVPGETRLGVHELAEALGRSRSWIYKRTMEKAEHRIPCSRLDGQLEFKAGEVRAWVRDREEVLCAGPMA